MSSSDRLVPLTLTISPSQSHYLYLPAEKNDKGKLVRQLMIFRQQKVEYGVDEEAKRTREEKNKCFIRTSTKSKDLIQEAKRSSTYLSGDHNPRNKMNHVINVWASKGLVFDAEGEPLPSSLSAPPEPSKANKDTPKKTKDDKSVSDNLPTSSKPTNTSTGAKDNEKPLRKVRNPFLSDSSESEDSSYDPNGLFVPRNPRAYAKFLAHEEEKKAEGSKAKQSEVVSKGKKSSRELARELFPSDEDDGDVVPKESRPRPRTTVGSQSSNPVKSTHGKARAVDLAGDKDNENQEREKRKPKRADTTNGSGVGIARRRDDRSKSPADRPKERRPRGESPHDSTRTPVGTAVKKVNSNQSTSTGTSTGTGRVRESKALTSEKLATSSGVYYKSKGAYSGGRQNWVEGSDYVDKRKSEMELENEKLKKIRRDYQRKHGRPL